MARGHGWHEGTDDTGKHGWHGSTDGTGFSTLIKLFSTTKTVLDASETILEQLNKNNYVGAGSSIDLKKAFDTVNHKIPHV